MESIQLLRLFEILDTHLQTIYDGDFVSGYGFDNEENLIVYDHFKKIRKCRINVRTDLFEFCILPLFCFNYSEAKEIVSMKLKINGHDDWRIPNLNECKIILKKYKGIEEDIIWCHHDCDENRVMSFHCWSCDVYDIFDNNGMYNALGLIRNIS